MVKLSLNKINSYPGSTNTFHQRALMQLPPRLKLSNKEKMIIKYRFGLTEDEIPRTYEEIAELLDMSKEMVRQSEAKAIKKLKHPSLSEQWKNIIETKRDLYG